MIPFIKERQKQKQVDEYIAIADICKCCNSPGFNPRILQHLGVAVAADELLIKLGRIDCFATLVQRHVIVYNKILYEKQLKKNEKNANIISLQKTEIDKLQNDNYKAYYGI